MQRLTVMRTLETDPMKILLLFAIVGAFVVVVGWVGSRALLGKTYE